MDGSSSAPPPLIHFPQVLGSSTGSSASSPTQNANMVTPHGGELPRQGPKRKRSSGVSTKLVLHDQWKIKKTLKESDLGQLSRLLLPLDCVEDYLFQLMRKEMVSQVKSNEGMQVRVRDTDTNNEHSLVFRHWESSSSYVLNNGWTKLFVKKRGLKVGDEIGIYWDNNSNKFHFTVLRRAAYGTSNLAA